MYYDIVESGKRIRELRTRKGVSRQELSEKLGVSWDALRKIENGINGAKIDTLVCIADLFSVSLDYLVYGKICDTEIADLLSSMGKLELQFVKNMIVNMTILKDGKEAGL